MILCIRLPVLHVRVVPRRNENCVPRGQNREKLLSVTVHRKAHLLLNVLEEFTVCETHTTRTAKLCSQPLQSHARNSREPLFSKRNNRIVLGHGLPLETLWAPERNFSTRKSCWTSDEHSPKAKSVCSNAPVSPILFMAASMDLSQCPQLAREEREHHFSRR